MAETRCSLLQFRYYFAQREAVETVIWLYDVRKARDKFDLLRFDASGAVSTGMFDEDWPRYVLKMATGAGKTNVLSLLMAWRNDLQLAVHIQDDARVVCESGNWIIETKGREEIELPQKMARRKQWCEDATAGSAANGGITCRFLYVDQAGFEWHHPASLGGAGAQLHGLPTLSLAYSS